MAEINEKDFISELTEKQPRYIVEMPFDVYTRCHGSDTTTEFTELRKVIEKDYIEVESGEGYIIYERIGSAESDLRD